MAAKDVVLNLLTSGLTLDELGQRAGVTRERVRQIIVVQNRKVPGSYEAFHAARDRARYAARARRFSVVPAIAAAIHGEGRRVTIAELSRRSGITQFLLREWGFCSDPRPLRHGTQNAYSRHNCRCEHCRAAVVHVISHIQHPSIVHRPKTLALLRKYNIPCGTIPIGGGA